MTDSPSETQLWLREWHDGDRAGLDKLLQRDLPWIRNYVEQRLGKLLRARADVDDYVQEAMIQVLQYGPRFMLHDKAQFRALVGRITENVLRDHAVKLRTKKRDVAMERPVPRDTLLDLDPPARAVTRPSMAANRNEEKAWIRLAIELLPPEDRSIVRMREWEKQSFAEIGDELGVSADAARMRFQRILPRLAQSADRLRRGQLAEVLADAPE